MVNLERESRGQQLNNSVKSVSPSPSKSKASAQRQARKDSYREKFGNRPHMIIPQEDSEFIETQKLSTVKLWLQCWRSDPYGNRWMPLNHSLKSSSFWEAKKILSERGLFLFKPDRSIRDGRETVCWLVLNLHGARRNDYWLESADLESADSEGKSTKSEGKSTKSEIDSAKLESISIKTQAQQGLQNPLGGSQEAPQKLLKGVSRELGIESEVGDRQAPTALDELVGSAPPEEEKKKPVNCSLDEKSQTDGSRENPDPIKEKKSPAS